MHENYFAKTASIVLLESVRLPTQTWGEFTLKVFQQPGDTTYPLALIKGVPDDSIAPVLVRLHSECLTGDLFDSALCDCGWQLRESLSRIAKQGGILLYLRQEGRGIGLINKLKAYRLQEQGLDTVEANYQLGFRCDERDYEVAAQMLQALNVKRIQLLTNNPQKISDLERYGIQVSGRLKLVAVPNVHNENYLKTKQAKLSHWLDF